MTTWEPRPCDNLQDLYWDLLRLADSLKNERMQTATAADIANASAVVNLRDKYESKPIWDSTGQRVLHAAGPEPEDDWLDALGSVSITPA